ncbi:MAG: lipoprotein-releasing system ATP-binding protein LolD [marine bacterium B5-7]|nr:MAG: lipoprotein-releasing system ATP-binding protein LolD [marine bacterium B5-7]
MSDVIRCENLGKTFVDGKQSVPVLDNINLTVAAGEQVAIVGASGSGKSTLLHLLGGLDKPNAGCVQVMGKDWQQLSERKRSAWRNQHLGFVYQFHHLLPEFTLLENVCMPLFIRGDSRVTAKKIALPLLEAVGLSHRLTHKPSALSGGERQRAAIVRALVTQPACVIADEPTGNLDAGTAKQVTDLLLRLSQEHQISLVVATHDQRLADSLARIVTLD